MLIVEGFKLNHKTLCAPYVSKLQTFFGSTGDQFTKYYIRLTQDHYNSEFYLTLSGEMGIGELQEVVVNVLQRILDDSMAESDQKEKKLALEIVEDFKGKRI